MHRCENPFLDLELPFCVDLSQHIFKIGMCPYEEHQYIVVSLCIAILTSTTSSQNIRKSKSSHANFRLFHGR
jgi:hypothetical protein